MADIFSETDVAILTYFRRKIEEVNGDCDVHLSKNSHFLGKTPFLQNICEKWPKIAIITLTAGTTIS
jgi:hypothetical protein